MDFTQSMDNGYMIPTSVAVGSGEATDIRCVCDTVEDFKTFLDATEMDLRYEGLITYEKVNKRLMVYKGNDTWQTVGEGGGSVDTSSFITLTQLSQQLSNYYTKAQTDNKISEEIAKAQLGGSGEVDLSAYATKNYVNEEIAKIGKLELPNLKGVLLENAENPLDIPTYDGSNQLVHSKVLYFENGWNGYKFWMAFTPLPYYPVVNENLENPSIVVSNDGEHWIVPNGLTNPIDDITIQNTEYNSDTHLVYNQDTDTLEIWYRHYLRSTQVETIYKKTSKDGINWGERIKIMNSENGSDRHLLSPVVIYDEGKYKLWFINFTYKHMPYYESVDGINFNKINDIKLMNNNMWHHDIIKSSNGKYLLVANLIDRQSCVYSESDDGINWCDCTTILTTSGKSTDKWDSEHLYRPNLTEVDGSYYFYYTGRNDDKTGAKQGLIKIPGTSSVNIDANAIKQNNYRNFVTKDQIQDIANCKNEISVLTELINGLNERIVNLENNEGVLDEIISIKLNPSSHSFSNIGETLTINKTFNPPVNINKTIVWESSDASVASVNNLGVVTAKKDGNCVITATTVNGKTDTCNITVNTNGNIYSTAMLLLDATDKGDGVNWVNLGHDNSISATLVGFNGTDNGFIGDELIFNGKNYVEVAGLTLDNFYSKSFTIVLDIKIANTACKLFANQYNTGISTAIILERKNANFWFANSSVETSDVPNILNVRSKIVYSYNCINKTGKIYINGSRVASGYLSSVPTSPNPIARIGSDIANINPFVGSLYKFAIFNKELSDEEINEL